jgi:hypothetical protein
VRLVAQLPPAASVAAAPVTAPIGFDRRDSVRVDLQFAR